VHVGRQRQLRRAVPGVWGRKGELEKGDLNFTLSTIGEEDTGIVRTGSQDQTLGAPFDLGDRGGVSRGGGVMGLFKGGGNFASKKKEHPTILRPILGVRIKMYIHRCLNGKGEDKWDVKRRR